MDNTFNFFAFFFTLICSAIGVPTTPLERLPDDGHDGRIVGGMDAEPLFAPHMVGLVHEFRARFLLCGGSIIGRQTVLTAAHCILSVLGINGLSPTLRGILGTTEWKDRDALNIKFADYIIHPAYDRWMVKNDIGVLITEEEIVMNKNVQAIELNFAWVGGGQMAYATGWGATGVGQSASSQLQLLHVPTTTPQQCIDGIREVSEYLGWWVPPVDPRIEICTLKKEHFGMCNGDSGSALVQLSTGQQIGIVSWGLACARGAPDVFVRLSGFQDWLTPIMTQYA